MEEKKKKTFSENAKDFLGAWKDDFAEKNKDILERAKKRKEENQKLNTQIKSLWDDIKIEFQGTAKELYDGVQEQMTGFMQAAKEGTATVAQKLEIEENIEKFKTFLQATQNRGEEEFSKIADQLKVNLNNLNIESSVDESMKDIKNQAEEEIANDNLEKLDELKKNADDLNNLFEEE